MRVPASSRGVGQELWLLLRLEWKHMGRSGNSKAVVLAALVGFLVLLGLLGFFLSFLLSVMDPFYGTRLLGLLFCVAALIAALMGVSSSLNSLYTGAELPLLFSAPVHMWTLFVARTLDMLSTAALFSLAIGVGPAIFAGLSWHEGALFYVLVVVAWLGSIGLGAVIDLVLLFLLMRVIAPQRLQEAVSVLQMIVGAGFGIGMGLLGASGNHLLIRAQSGDAFLQGLHRFDGWPPGWIGAGLDIPWSGISGLLPLVGWLALGVGGYVGMVLLLARSYLQGWAGLAEGGGARRRQHQKASERHQGKATPLTSGFFTPLRTPPAERFLRATYAIARKDLKSMLRDARQWVGLFSIVLMIGFFIVMSIQVSEEPAAGPNLPVLFVYLFIALLVGGGTLGLNAFGREGLAVWVVNASPLSGWPLVWAKFLVSLFPVLVVFEGATLFTVLALLHLSATFSAILALAVALLLVGLVAISLWVSAGHARYNPENPSSTLDPAGMLPLYAASFIYLLLVGYGCTVALLPESVSAMVAQNGPTWLQMVLLPATWPGIANELFGWGWSGLFFVFCLYYFLRSTVQAVREGVQVTVVHGTRTGRRGRFSRG
ncbi:MAG: hypothetical protein IMW91_06125 [Firmicutes bacterium]|nr:hypothetical protein [Bacillota bacterium]